MQPSSATIGCWASRDTLAYRLSASFFVSTVRRDRVSTPTAGIPDARAVFDRLLGELRPKLHRYCARMTGSAVDGEDVVQEAFLKAIEAQPEMGTVAHPEGWLFRIAHNAALDFLRRRARQDATRSDQDPDMIIDPVTVTENRQAAAASLRTFLRLPVSQRSSVILMDVLGYSLEEIGDIMESSIPAVKAALHRGRERLRKLSVEPDDLPAPVLAEPERRLLAGYVDRFNARDFDAIREMLAEEVRLELVSKSRMDGRSKVGRYFDNYTRLQDWQLVPGWVDRRAAVLVRDPSDPSKMPTYFVLLEWAADRVVRIRDFRFACYAIESAELFVVDL
jgi:RNA polymerase sigma-70 factor, ECF subfamily